MLWVRTSPTDSAGEEAGKPGNPAIKLLKQELLRDRQWILSVVVATAIVNLLAVATSLFAMQVY